MNKGFVGGLLASGSWSLPESDNAAFQWSCTDTGNWLWSWDMDDQIFVWDRLVILILGHLTISSSNQSFQRDSLAEELRWRYIEEGILDLSGMDGNATVILLDSQNKQLLLSRPAQSLIPVYYQPGVWGVRFASTPALLTRSGGEVAQPDRQAALNWVHKGIAVDRETLFQGIYRLVPGEVLMVSQQGIARYPNAALGNFPKIRESTLLATVREQLKTGCRPWVELNGSMASVALQVLRNQTLASDELLPCSASLCLDQPTHWEMTDQAIKASRILGTEHHLIQPKSDAQTAWLRSLAATGEPIINPKAIYGADYACELGRYGATHLWLDTAPEMETGTREEAIRAFQEAERFSLLLQQAGIQVVAPFLDSRLIADSNNSASEGLQLKRLIQQLIPAGLQHSQLDQSGCLKWFGSKEELTSALKHLKNFDLCSPGEIRRARPGRDAWLHRLLAYNFWFQMFVENHQTIRESRPWVYRQLEKAS